MRELHVFLPYPGLSLGVLLNHYVAKPVVVIGFRVVAAVVGAAGLTAGQRAQAGDLRDRYQAAHVQPLLPGLVVLAYRRYRR